jgi:hypothetical protein
MTNADRGLQHECLVQVIRTLGRDNSKSRATYPANSFFDVATRRQGGFMNRSLMSVAVAISFLGGSVGNCIQAQVPVTWDGGNFRWEAANWTKDGVSGLTAMDAMGDNTGGRGGLAISIGGGSMVEYDPNPGSLGGLGDFKPRMDLTPGGSLTIKEGAVLSMDSHTGSVESRSGAVV